MAQKLKHPTVCIEIPVTEKICPELKEIMEQGDQFQQKMSLVQWYYKNQESDAPVGGRVTVRLPR